MVVDGAQGVAELERRPVGRAVAGRFADNLPLIREGEMPPWSEDRILYLCWKGSTNDWLLAEDSETTNQMRELRKRRSAPMR